MGSVKRIRNVEWEKNRRDRLNSTFSELSKLLPHHDPAIVLTKVEILTHSIAYIKELKDKYSHLVESSCSDELKSEVESMKKMVADLKIKNCQLVDLLRVSESNRPLFHPPRKWTGKLSPNSGIPLKLKKKAKKMTKSKTISKNLTLDEPKKAKVAASAPLREINNGGMELDKSTSKPAAKKRLTISTHIKTTHTNNIVTIAKPTIIDTGIQPVLHRNPTLSTLGPGTLILRDGRVVPVPAPPAILATTTQLIVNRPTQPAVFLVQNLAPVKTVMKNRPIVRKPPQKDTTKTTYVNKVPIPAATTHTSIKTLAARDSRNSNFTKNATKVIKKCIVKKKAVAKEPRKSIDKCVTKYVFNDKPVVASDKSESDHNVCNQGKTPNEMKVQTQNNCSSLDIVDNPHGSKSCPIKRKIPNEEENIIDNIKRSKVSDTSDIQRENFTDTQIPKIQNNSVTQNISQEKDKEQINQLKIDEKSSADNNTSQDNMSKSNLELSAEISLLTRVSGSVFASEQTNGLECQENSCNQENQCNALTKINSEESNQNRIEHTIQITSEKDVSNNTDPKVKTFKTHHEVISVPQSKSNIDNTTQHVCMSEVPVSKMSDKREPALLSSSKYQENNTRTSSEQEVKQSKMQSEVAKLSINATGKNNSEKKEIMQDDGQELSSLFSTDTKLQPYHESIFRETDFRDRNLFIPIGNSYMDEVRLSIPHSDFSNDLFSSLQVPTAGQHSESISPTAAFLLAFPLVSTSKTSELIGETETGESQHPTPTTILQIGNIDPPADSYHHAMMIESSVPALQNPKNPKSIDTIPSNNISKQKKNTNSYGPLQNVGMGQLLRSESVNRNCEKEKKHFSELHDQDMFLACNKKKMSGRQCDYPVSSEMIPTFQDKSFQFPLNNMRHNRDHHNANSQTRVNVTNNNQTRVNVTNNNQTKEENLVESQHLYNTGAHAYPYAGTGFSGSNDFPLPNSSTSSNNQPVHDSPKPSQISSKFNPTIWSTSTTSATTNRIDYSSPYCANPQKSFKNVANKNVNQKVHLQVYEEQILKEKSTTNNALSKFAGNFQFNNNNTHPSQDSQNYQHTGQTDNINYKLDSKSKKAKSNSQRPPVNWMTTPDIRPIPPDHSVLPSIPDATYQLQKDLEYNSTVILNTPNTSSHFNISSSVSNNPQVYYSNSHYSGIDFQYDFAPFPEITSSSKITRGVSSGQQNGQYSWSPSKCTVPMLPHLDTHMIPSTLPTLVGDLALGTSTPSGPVDTFRALSMPTTPFNMDNMGKKSDIKQETTKNVIKSAEKVSFGGPEQRRNGSRNVPDYCQRTHSLHSTNTTTSFLSVSQLVDQVKHEQVSSKRSGKHTGGNKNTSGQKRNHSSHQVDKTNNSKTSTNLNLPNNFQPQNSVHSVPLIQTKTDVHHGYQENSGAGFEAQVSGPSWQQSKAQRPSTHYKGSYSAESLIGGNPTHDHIPDLPPFTVGNHYSNQYSQTPVVPGTSYSSHNLSHQEIQSFEYNPQNPHKNCFNFPNQNTHYSTAPFNPENEFHLGLDPLYSFNSSTSRNISCQTSTHVVSRDNRSSHKRMHSSKRRDEYAGPQQNQSYPRGKDSPGHPSTTSLTNFNLSTIFPEINDKRVAAGPNNTFHTSPSKLGDSVRSNGQTDYSMPNFNTNMSQIQQVGSSSVLPHFPPVNLDASPATNNFKASTHS